MLRSEHAAALCRNPMQIRRRPSERRGVNEMLKKNPQRDMKGTPAF
jgi:hypothetical protein